MSFNTKLILSDKKFIQPSGETITFNGNVVNNNVNVVSGNSVVTKNFVENLLITSGLTQANNGIINQGGTISLGGSLTGNTKINLQSYGLALGQFAISTADTSIAMGKYAQATYGGSVAIGKFAQATSYNATAIGGFTYSCGTGTLAAGGYSCAYGSNTIAIGTSVKSDGFASIVMGRASNVNASDALVIGGNNNNVYSSNSSIVGGSNNNILSGNTNAAIIGGSNINLTGTSYIQHTAVSNLAIWSTPSAGSSGDTVLVRDSSTGIIKQINQSGITGGGSTTAGNDTEIIFNNNGTLTGSSRITFDNVNNNLRLNAIVSSYYGIGTNSTIINGNNYTSAMGDFALSIGKYSDANGNNSFASGAGITCGNYGFAHTGYALGDSSVGIHGRAFGCRSVAIGGGASTRACGDNSIAIGRSSCAIGTNSIAIGRSSVAYAPYSINISTKTNNTNDRHCINAAYSNIFGGYNNNITASASTGTTIIGGRNITLTGSTYANHVLVPKLAIMDSPSAGSSGDTVLVRDSSTGIIKEISQSNLGGEADINSSNTEIIFNNNGALSGNTGFTFSGATQSFTHGTRQGGYVEGYRSVVLNGLNNYATGDWSISVGKSSYATGCISFTHGYYNIADGNVSVALSYGSTGQNALGAFAANGGFANGVCSSAFGSITNAGGDTSFAIGRFARAIGNCSFAGGCGLNSGRLYSCGDISFNFSTNCSGVVSGEGANATRSVILGGYNQHIASGNTGTLLLGGGNIKLTGTSYIDHTVVGDLAIFNQPSAGTSGDTILVRDSSTGIIKEISQNAVVSSSISVDNGLSIANDGDIVLGGTLTGNTKINIGTNSFVIGGGVATGTSSIAFGLNSNAFGENSFAAGSAGQAYGYSSISIGNFSTACGGSSFATQYGTADGQTAIGMGSSTAVGDDAIAIGRSMNACAKQSIAIGGRDNCVFAFNSSILGGAYNSISSGNTFTTLIGGNNIDLTGNTYASHTVVSNLAIFNQPSAGTSGDTLLVRDSISGIIKEVSQASISGSEGTVNNILDVDGVTTITASTNNHVLLVDTSGATQTITLPNSPVDGQSYIIKDKGNALTNNITLDGNGNNIDDAATATINTDYGALEVVYSEPDGQWYVLSFVS